MQLVVPIIRYYRMPLLLLGFCLGLIFIRLLVSGSFFFGFLAWNLILAIIPYLITQTVMFYGIYRIPKAFQILLFLFWLLFLPNAPYLITDLVHLHSSFADQRWLDLFIVFVFALTGWLFGLLSLLDFNQFIRTRIVSRASDLILIVICFTTGYGLYLGRFLRFNSWDIVFKTETLLREMAISFAKPYVWLMTLAFGSFLCLSFWFLKWVKEDS
ncbi:DUF1361 domain-containing protein [Croceivirga thetidis]|uniref:DUF1361 domain-containing protein n=1 Tax=Croceivirga thetidis TaxID=2721623 RepID=A0ABX1GU12_9FLAO|nr:DUF1361 domain-containing protein [Croceivirga thetidis]NKI33138.1 DUF1361 domain-containing protein [Croceivirga thetidis]